MIKPNSKKFVFRNSIELSFARFCYRLFSFSHQESFYNRFFLSLNGLSTGKVVSFTKNENALLVYYLESFMKSLNSV